MIDEQLLAKLLVFVSNLTLSQFDWILAVRGQDWTVDEPKLLARRLFDQAARASVRQSVAYPLVKLMAEDRKVNIDPQELSRAAYRAYEAWEKVGTEQFPPPPPLVLDPILKELNQKPVQEQ